MRRIPNNELVRFEESVLGVRDKNNRILLLVTNQQEIPSAIKKKAVGSPVESGGGRVEGGEGGGEGKQR